MSAHRPETSTRPADDAVSDRELLRRFDVGQDEAAFAMLLRRHGAMVLRVCRRVLDRQEDAEDAFQATFLVLARKAGSVAWHESVATWLHTTARQLARETHRSGTRRKVRETRSWAPGAGDEPADDVSSRELLAILDEELAGLPEEYRGPLLLCCMEGMSGDEAAAQLGCSPSTVKRRLRDGRELLQARLTRRGVAMSAAGMLTLLAAGAAVASLPPTLADVTVRAAVQFHARVALTPGLVSGRAVELARHLLPAMSVKLAAVVALVVAVGAIGVGRGGGEGGADTPAPAADVSVKAAAAAPPAARGVAVVVETTLPTSGPFIRQYAFDGVPDSFFASATNPGADDHFTLVFDEPVAVTAVGVRTGTPNHDEALTSGRLEVSADGIAFEKLADFAGGAARGDAGGRKLVAVRVRPGARPHPLLVREFEVRADPPLGSFRHPVEFAVDAAAAPEMKAWAERAARACERAYPMICDELASDGFRPPARIPFVVRGDAGAVAAAAGGRVIASAGYFAANPHDVGAIAHATSLVVQAYPGRVAPGWLVHGVADYVRFHKFEPWSADSPDPDTARYDGDSRETAAFLAYLVATYDPALVRRLNAALRQGRYTDDIWVTLTGKPLRELGAEWRRSLRR
jgi:RNA polymerase sigma factor (sigma-70 family)